MITLALPLTLVIFAVALLLVRGRGMEAACPRCGGQMHVVASPQPPHGAYGICACTQCAYTSTRVHGVDSPLAYCPACRQRSLQVRTHRVPGLTVSVAVDEHCHLCGHEADFTVGTHAAPGAHAASGKVLPFRRRGNDDTNNDAAPKP